MTRYKHPVSVLVVIHTPDRHILLLERALQTGFWQSVTGSQEDNESLVETAAREVFEETGITVPITRLTDWQLTNYYEIFPEWRQRYAPGVTHNTEHVYSLMVPSQQAITLAPDEHLNYEWFSLIKAAEKCFSPTNRDAILSLPTKIFVPPIRE